MGDYPGRQAATSQTIAAGATLELTFSNLGHWTQLVCMAKAVLASGAALRFSAKVKPENSADWYDVRVVDAQGASLSTLVANVAFAATATKAVFILPLCGPKTVKIVIEETGGVAGATLDVWALTD